MRALIETPSFRVWSLHQTHSQMCGAMGRFHVSRQFVEQEGESAPVNVMAAELHTARKVGETCTKEDFTVLSSHQTPRKTNARNESRTGSPPESNKSQFPF